MNAAWLLIVIIGSGAVTLELPDAETCAQAKAYTEQQIAASPNLPPSGVACFRQLGGRSTES